MTRTVDRPIPPVARHPLDEAGSPIAGWRYRPVIALEQVPQALYAWDDSDPAVVWDAVGAPTSARLVFPGPAGNYVSVPDAANLDLTADVEVVVRVGLNNWATIPISGLVNKSNDPVGSGQAAYQLRVRESRRLEFGFSTTGTTWVFQQSNVLPALTNGALIWVRARFDANDGAGNRVVTFDYAPDAATEPTSWTTLGTFPTAGAVATLFVGTARLFVGTDHSTRGLAGRVARVIVRNAIAGTTVLDINENDGLTLTGSTFRATSGQTVTVVQTAGNTIVQPDPGEPPYVWDEPAVSGWVDAVCDWIVADIEPGEPDDLYLYPPAQLTLTLDNADGAYTPWTADGRLTYWAPGRQIAVFAHRLADATDWWLFGGRVSSWQVNADATVTVTAFDGLSWLAQEVGGDWTPGAGGDIPAQRITAAAAAIGYPDPLRLDAGTVHLTTAPTDRSPLEAVEVAALSDGGLFYGDADGTLVYRDRGWRAGRDDQPQPWVISDNVCTVPVIVWDPLMASDDERLATDVRLVNVAGLVATATQTSIWQGDARYVLAHPDPDQWSSQAEGDALAAYLLAMQGTPAMAMRSFDLHALSPNNPAVWDMAVLARPGDLVEVLHDFPDAAGNPATLDVIAVCLTVAHNLTPEAWVSSFGLSRTVDWRRVEQWDRTLYLWDDPNPLNVWRF